MRGLFLSSGIKGHLLEAPPSPGPGSLTASNLHIQFAFQDFLHRAPTIRIPKPSRGESLDVFLPWGGRRPMKWGLHAWLTPVPQGLTVFVEGKDGREGKITNHTPLPEQKSQTTGKSFSDPAFQMGLSPDSFKFLPACLHLNSLQASCICSPLLSNSSGHQTSPESKSTNKFPWTHILFALNRPVLPQVSTVSPSLFLAVHYVSSVLPFALCFLPEYQGSLSFWSGLLNCFLLSGQSYPSSQI